MVLNRVQIPCADARSPLSTGLAAEGGLLVPDNPGPQGHMPASHAHRPPACPEAMLSRGILVLALPPLRGPHSATASAHPVGQERPPTKACVSPSTPCSCALSPHIPVSSSQPQSMIDQYFLMPFKNVCFNQMQNLVS